MPELLIELRSEEIPARMQARAADDLKRLVTERLKDAGLAFDTAEAYVTPRRLALVVDGLPEKQPDVKEERKGPKVGAPDQAIQGFMKSAGIDSLEACEIREVKGAEFYFVVTEKKGGEVSKVISAVVRDTLQRFPWPKSMAWGEREVSVDALLGTLAGDVVEPIQKEALEEGEEPAPDTGLTWVRPILSIIAIFNGQIVRGVAYLGGDTRLRYGNTTRGHRFLDPGEFAVTDFADYQAKLEKKFVILDREVRKARIREGAEKLAKDAGLTVKDDPALLDEVAGLVEWPVVLMGAIDAEFMEVPPEALTSAMRTHQKYFALESKYGAMAPHFIVVSNMESADGGKAIVAGNERVLRARLSDAKFFWDQDLKQGLSARTPALKEIIFHARLGTVDEKMDRVQALAVEIAKHIDGADADKVRSAARLAKADLTTEMVGEFPELQGLMGRYYALKDGEDEAVADAIAEHYSPLGPNDACPTQPVSVAVALADKIDTLVGFWAIDEKPTGSKDPYALRRAALGVIRLVLENGLRLPLVNVFTASAASYGKTAGGFDAADLLSFFADRLKVHLKDAGTRHDLVTAVFERGDEDDLVRLMARVEALTAFLETEDGGNLLTAYKRAANILRIEEKKEGAVYAPKPDAKALAEAEEKRLFEALGKARTASGAALEKEDFAAAMAALSDLRAPVDAFFDKVTVNADDAALRANRLKLLAQIRATMDEVADFSKIEG